MTKPEEEIDPIFRIACLICKLTQDNMDRSGWHEGPETLEEARENGLKSVLVDGKINFIGVAEDFVKWIKDNV